MSKKFRLLIVDDDPDIRVLLNRKLTREGYEVTESENGAEALDMFRKDPPDLVLLDADLPGLDGFQTCAGMKAHVCGHEIPVIMVTALEDERSVDRAFNAGAEEYVHKPIRWPILKQRIRLILERQVSLFSLQESEKRFRHITDSITEAILSVDDRGRIVFWNHGAQRVFGYSDREVTNKPLEMLIPEDLRDKHRQAFDRAVREQGIQSEGRTVESLGQRKSGEIFPMEISLSVWHNPERIFFSAIIRDITEQKRVFGGLEETALFDSRLIEQITTLLNEARGVDSPPISRLHIRSIMETVFLAGLYREEDHPVLPNVSLMDRGFSILPGKKEKRGYQTLVLDRRIPFTIDALVKLAMGFDPENTLLAVCPQEGEGGNLEIWGAVFQEPGGVTRLSPMFRHAPPDGFLSVYSNRAGSLVVSWGGRVLARFHAGHFSLPGSGSFETCLIGQTLFKTVRKHEEFLQFGENYWRWYRDFIQRILIEIGRGAYGGIVVWLPDDDESRTSKSSVSKYRFTNAQEASGLIGSYCSWRNVETGPIKKKKKNAKEAAGAMLEQAKRFAHLSRVDGALILSHRLRPLSFGSMLVAHRWQGRTLYCLDDHGASIQEVDLDKYGTRHVSAVNFVGRFPGVVAFVVSQDGPIAGLTRMGGDRVLWLPDLMNRF